MVLKNLCDCRWCVQVFVAWLDMVTYLHHHGHEDKLPWYRGKVNILEIFCCNLEKLGDSQFFVG